MSYLDNFDFHTDTMNTTDLCGMYAVPDLSGTFVDLMPILITVVAVTAFVLSFVTGYIYSRFVTQYVFLVAVCTLVSNVGAVCPGCFGNIASCSYDSNGKCPSIDTPSGNALLVAGAASATATALTLTGVISARFLRMFTRAHLQLVLQLVKRPSPGSIFEIKKDTKLADILSAVGNGMITMEQAAITFAGFIDDESDDDARAALTTKFKLITSTKDLKSFTGSNAVVSDTGVYSWLWRKITNFVAERGMQVKVEVQVAAASSDSASSANVLSTTIKRAKDSVEFFESLNLFIMFTSALGLCSAVACTEFIEFVVFDTIRMRGYPWQVAHELFIVMLRRIEDSGGRITMVNCINESHLNTVLDEAQVSATRHYGSAFFRARAGNAQRGGADDKVVDGVKWNGKFTATSKLPCGAFNSGGEHAKSALLPDGTCKFAHVCDKWVTNKGKNGKCLCTAGTPGHSRGQCDNPNKCDAAVQ